MFINLKYYSIIKTNQNNEIKMQIFRQKIFFALWRFHKYILYIFVYIQCIHPNFKATLFRSNYTQEEFWLGWNSMYNEKCLQQLLVSDIIIIHQKHCCGK